MIWGSFGKTHCSNLSQGHTFWTISLHSSGWDFSGIEMHKLHWWSLFLEQLKHIRGKSETDFVYCCEKDFVHYYEIDFIHSFTEDFIHYFLHSYKMDLISREILYLRQARLICDSSCERCERSRSGFEMFKLIRWTHRRIDKYTNM